MRAAGDFFYKQTASLIKPEGAERDYYYAEFVPKEDSPIVWGRIVAKVRKEDYIPVREEFYDEKGNLMRIMELKKIKLLGGKTIPAVMELVPLNKKGHRTIVTYTDATFDLELPKDIFTLRNLQKRR